ncbi:MAG: hypothetical protein M5T52_12055 [Ignavibacteriaceae bacterium]|nr:hypothetical protein [Ignavibacteriaceae bacterium]
MLQKKKKLSKKEIKKDSLLELYESSIEFFEKYKSKIMLYAGVLVVAVAAVYFYLNQKSQTNEKAGLELSRIMSIYDQGSYLEAIEGKQGTNVIGLKISLMNMMGQKMVRQPKYILLTRMHFLEIMRMHSSIILIIMGR